MATPLPTTLLRSNTSTKPTPSKPLLRRATLSGTVRTRDEAGMDFDSDINMLTPPSPSKRQRTVTFNPLVEQQVFSSSLPIAEPDVDLEGIRMEVRSAIEDHNCAVTEVGFEELKEVFRPAKRGREAEAPSNEKIRAYLLALTSSVSLLGKSCSPLVRLILDFEWMGREEGLVKVYVHFLGNLASAQGAYVASVLSMLVEKFSGSKSPSYPQQVTILKEDTVRLSSGRLQDCAIVSREQLSSRVHMALKYLLRLIPSASSTLAPILSSNFPFSDKSKKIHMTYIQNLLRIHDYAPELKDETFALVTERLVKIDVQMQVDLDDLDDEVATAIVQAISLQSRTDQDGELEDDSDSDADSISSDDEDESDQIREVQNNVEKMDSILDMLFKTYTPYFSDPNSSSANSMFQTLLSHFRNTILPTYRSRHTQFLLFHFAQTSERHIDEFAGECVDLAFKSGNAAILKQSAAAYLASFVSRGAHVRPEVVRDVFDFIGTQLDIIRIENEKNCRGPDLHRYGTFYATTQALLYIFCFRWRDLIVTDSDDDVFDDDDPVSFLGRDLEWREGIKELLSRTIYSKLNPLKICAPAIVEEFAKIANKLSFMYVYPLLETNKRVRLSQFALGAGSKGGLLRDSGFANQDGDGESWHQLDAYFPFDPYQLPVSRRWIEGDYVVWKGIPGRDEDGDDDSTDEEDGGLEMDDEEEDDNTATDDDEDNA